MRLNHPQGQAAEDAALAFLQGQGCRLIERNRHCPHGEIDLIMESGGVLLFVEVKYRKSVAFGGAAYRPNSPSCKKAPNCICNSTRNAAAPAASTPY